MKKIIDFCFLYPLTASALNFQGWLTLYTSDTYGQILAYGNLLFICLGFVLLVKKKAEFTTTGSLWIPYFLLFYAMVSFASILNDHSYLLLSSLVPVIYFIGFLSYFRFQENIRKFEILIMIAFAIANIFLLYFVSINFDLDFYLMGLEIDFTKK